MRPSQTPSHRNVQKRANCEPKRHSRAVQAFPSRELLIRILGAAFSEMDENWAFRRWSAEGPIALAAAPMSAPAPAPSYDGTAGECARRTMEVVATDNPVRRRAA